MAKSDQYILPVSTAACKVVLLSRLNACIDVSSHFVAILLMQTKGTDLSASPNAALLSRLQGAPKLSTLVLMRPSMSSMSSRLQRSVGIAEPAEYVTCCT